MRRNIFGKFLLVCVLSAAFLITPCFSVAYEQEIKNLSATMAEQIDRTGRKRIAVLDFTDLQGNITELGRFLTEEISVALAGAGKGFEVIDRTNLKVILQEHKLQLTDIIDPATVRKLGEIAGVEALLIGTITPFGDSVRLSVKLLDTGTAKVVNASAINIAKTKAIEELLARGITSAQPAIGGQQPAVSGGTSKSLPTIKVEEDGFSFEVKECKLKSGKTVELKLIVVNNGEKERKLNICGHCSLLTDNEGQQYEATRIRFGSREERDWVDRVLPSQLPTAATLISEGVSPQAQSITFRIQCQGDKEFFPLFRNVPLIR